MEFCNDNYHVVKASAIKGSYLYGVEYIKSEIKTGDVFKYWEERYVNNVILFADSTPSLKNPDMEIILKQDVDIPVWNKEKIIISAFFLLTNIKEIY